MATLVVLPFVLAFGHAQIHPIDTDPRPPSPPNFIDGELFVTPWPIPDHEFQPLLHHHLINSFELPYAHITPVHRDPITIEQLEDQIRHSANKLRFIQLGIANAGRSMRIAFAVSDTYQSHGQKYFALLRVGHERELSQPYVMVVEFVKVSGVGQMGEEIPRPTWLRGARVLTLPGAALTGNEVLEALRLL
ncbi:hypothetical protein PHBOTO_006659 [Pseudozyma hubeiensis]|nr:hypothetical protein PHBOTO_006179 [Pseudozyma hubeiensis]KAJ9478512.1 hypothetical protein PHBOTO_006533 [Pseudozyma hubeiensis]KAJ9479887.1 hypothetical protein PHBOTO_006659 [Pseudozyma hubeiensis]